VSDIVAPVLRSLAQLEALSVDGILGCAITTFAFCWRKLVLYETVDGKCPWHEWFSDIARSKAYWTEYRSS